MKFTPHKAVISAIGTSLTAVATAWAAVENATSDGLMDATDYGSVATAVAVAVATVYAVWRVPNRARTDAGDYSNGGEF